MDVISTSIHLPINAWVANAALVHEDFVVDGGTVTKPTIQNLKDIQDNGVSLEDYIDDETVEFNETKEIVEVPVLTSSGVQTKTVGQMLGATEIVIPIQSFTYTLQAIMHGLDPDDHVVNDADARFDNAGYTDDGGSAIVNATYDKVATMIDRIESIVTDDFCLLVQVDPADPSLGDKYFLAPKVKINKDSVMNDMSSEYFQETLNFRSLLLTDAELTRWQNILPNIKKSIGFYAFHIKTPAS